MLALGGDAKMTKRATSEHEKRGKINVGSFIRYGCNKAEIRVRLSNMTDDEGLAYRSEVYGAAIVMERQIYKSPQEVVTSRHIVRNCAGKIVYEQSELRCKHIDIFDNSYVKSISELLYVAFYNRIIFRQGPRGEEAHMPTFRNTAGQSDDDSATGGSKSLLRKQLG